MHPGEDQKTKNRRRLKKALPPVFVLFIALAISLWPRSCLTARAGHRLLFAWPIKAGERFTVTFMHSYNLSPVTDVIAWTGEDLNVEKSVFTAFGAGIPVPADGIGQKLEMVDGRYELTGINKRMKSFSVLTQELPDHRVSLNGREASLPELAGPGQPVKIAVERIPNFLAWIGGQHGHIQ